VLASKVVTGRLLCDKKQEISHYGHRSAVFEKSVVAAVTQEVP
jgi:hypothetical protein